MSEHRVVRRLREFIAEEISPKEMRNYIRNQKRHEDRIAVLERQVRDLFELNNMLTAKVDKNEVHD